VLVGLVVIALGETAGAVISSCARDRRWRKARRRESRAPRPRGSAEYDAEVTARAVYAAEAGLSFFHTHARAWARS
jgi:hypothetical protein